MDFGAVARSAALEGTTVARTQFAVEAFLDHIAYGTAQRLDADVANHLVAEGVGQHGAGGAFGDAAGAHIEHGLVVELTYCRAVGTLHVVVVNLQERLGLHMSLVGQEDIAVVLYRLGLVGTVLYEHMSVNEARALSSRMPL